MKQTLPLPTALSCGVESMATWQNAQLAYQAHLGVDLDVTLKSIFILSTSQSRIKSLVNH